jgi:hypothetical protein
MQGQTGNYVLTTMVTPPTSSALTTLANVKDDLGLTSETDQDTRLTRYINEESANIARHCNRVFGRATWQDVFRPQHGVWGEGVRAAVNPLKLSRWPLVAAIATFTGTTVAGNVVVTGVANAQSLTQGQLVSGPGIAAGTTISIVGATQIWLSAAPSATATAVPLSAGISVVETVAGVDTGLTAGTDFEVELGSSLPGDEGPACLYRLNQQGNPRTWPAAKVTVVYQAGYALPNDSNPNFPMDLQSVCIRIVVARFKAKDRDPTLVERVQPNVGSERWWVGAAPGQSGPYPNELMATLDRYRTPVTASA